MAVSYTTNSAIPYPDIEELISSVPGHIAALANAIDNDLILKFTDVSNRDAVVTAPAAGMVAWTSSEKRLWVYANSQWNQIWPAVPNITSGTAAPTASGSAGDLYFQYTA